MIIPPQTRTLFFYYPYYYGDIYKNFNPKVGQKHLNNQQNNQQNNNEIFQDATFKFKLNLPKFEVLQTSNDEWKIYALNDNNNTCWMPLPNVYYDNNIVCIGRRLKPLNFDEFKETFFTSKFTFSLTDQLRNYIADPFKDKIKAFLKFYQNWQDSGKINLIKKYNNEFS